GGAVGDAHLGDEADPVAGHDRVDDELVVVAADGAAHLDLLCAAGAHQLPDQLAGVGAIEDRVVAGEIGHAARAAARLEVGGGGVEAVRASAEAADDEGRVFERAEDQSDVDLAADDLGAACGGDHVDVDVRVLP